MIKGMSKITALLVAASSIMSIVPAMAADSVRLGTKDGTIERAIAFNGKYIFEGYKGDEDKAVYINDGQKDKELADFEDYTFTTGTYADKYALAEDGSEDYLVDLTNGSISDDTLQDMLDSTASKLEKVLKRTDKYTGVTVGSADLNELRSSAKFQQPWYSVVKNGNTIFTDANGKYIDSSVLANIYAYSTAKGKVVKVEKFNKPYSDTGLKVDLLAAPTVIAQDKDFIYAVVNVRITDSAATAPTDAWYLQKISKAQGDVDEKAYTPKSVASYQIDNKSLYDNGDANDAYSWLINAGAVDTANIVNVEVKDGSLYVYKLQDSDTIKVNKLDLKQIKEYAVNKTVYGSTKLDGYVVKKDGDTDQDFQAYSIDVNGNLWILNKGKIIKFAQKDKTTVYTCDSGLNELDVYDANNLVAWNYDDERYTTVSEGTKVTQGDAAIVTPVIKTGWQQEGSNWYFNDATGAKVVNKWVNVGGAWYFLKADGAMATGWVKDGASWYFLNASGAMRTGWIKDGANWYYLKSSGAMATGWVNDNGSWYFLNGSGAMLSNTTVNGYKLGASGAWVK